MSTHKNPTFLESIGTNTFYTIFLRASIFHIFSVTNILHNKRQKISYSFATREREREECVNECIVRYTRVIKARCRQVPFPCTLNGHISN